MTDQTAANKPDFESIKQISPYNAEYWSARDLAPKLGYTNWRRFEDAINRAIISCRQTSNKVDDHYLPSHRLSPCWMRRRKIERNPSGSPVRRQCSETSQGRKETRANNCNVERTNE